MKANFAVDGAPDLFCIEHLPGKRIVLTPVETAHVAGNKEKVIIVRGTCGRELAPAAAQPEIFPVTRKNGNRAAQNYRYYGYFHFSSGKD
jgi:hypothetical protein